MEVEVCRFQKTILEVIEIEEHTVLVKLRLRITIAPVQPHSSLHLYSRQLSYGVHEQLLLFTGIASTGIPSCLESIVERSAAKVGLQIAQLIIRHTKNGRHRKFHRVKMFGKIYEGVVLVATCSNDSYYSLACRIRKSVILTVAASSRNLLRFGGFLTRPSCIKFYELFHDAKVRK